MIEYLRGRLADLTPAMAVVDCQGVGYGVNISLNTYAAIQGREEVRLWITESIREDAYQLWGFESRIGAASARMVLSAMTPAELCAIISDGNDKMLRQVKGIGPKAAQRIIVDLHDKIATLDIVPVASTAGQTAPSVNMEVQKEAEAALTMLGFSPAPTHKVVVKILQDEPDAAVERVIKLALKML